MVDLSTSSDQEQIDAIKTWWKENGLSIVLGVVLGVGGIFGWKYWQTYETTENANASEAFEAVQGDITKTKAFVSTHANSVYAADLSLSQAATAAAKGEYKVAEELLLPLLDASVQKSYTLLARINLAKIYVADNKAEKALEVLRAEKDYGHFSAQQQWALGDALVKVGKKSEAKIAYQTALLGFKDNQALSGLIQLKLNNL